MNGMILSLVHEDTACYTYAHGDGTHPDRIHSTSSWEFDAMHGPASVTSKYLGIQVKSCGTIQKNPSVMSNAYSNHYNENGKDDKQESVQDGCQLPPFCCGCQPRVVPEHLSAICWSWVYAIVILDFQTQGVLSLLYWDIVISLDAQHTTQYPKKYLQMGASHLPLRTDDQHFWGLMMLTD